MSEQDEYATATKPNELDDWFRHVGTQMSNEDYERGIQVIAAEHAEVERLNGALRATDDFRIADWQKLEAERDDAESEAERLRGERKELTLKNDRLRKSLHEAEAELGMVEQRYSAYDRQIETFTAQLQAVREANDWARSEERTTTDWALDSDARRSEILAKLGNRLDAILDAAADGSER